MNADGDKTANSLSAPSSMGQESAHLADQNFAERKVDHIRLSLDDRMQAFGSSGLDDVELLHEALPDLDFSDVSIKTTFFHSGRKKYELATPFFVSSMTAGHAASGELNLRLARGAEARGWGMGVGSQRRQLFDHVAAEEWREIRKTCPRVHLFGNIGLAQVIELMSTKGADSVKKLADSLEATAMFVHLNPLQECLQPEGTPRFRGGLKALEQLVRELQIPVIVKETGCGFSPATLKRLSGLGVAAVDVAGLGGTHWGRIEGGRAGDNLILSSTAQTFKNWGVGTARSIRAAVGAKADYEVWASGGLRSGLDAARCFALGARMAGFAQPLLRAAVQSEETLDVTMAAFEYELKTALFCTGSRDLEQLRELHQWL
jgi:isopentenyl-diphosphate Delta-isomerase